MSGDQKPLRGPGKLFLGPRLAASLLLAFGLLVLSQSFQIPLGGGYSAISPRFFPMVVAVGLLLLGGILLLRTTVLPDRGLQEQLASEQETTDWSTVLQLGLALTIYPFLLRPLGYVVATTLFIPLGAYILGSRRPRLSFLVAIILSLVIYIGFTQFLGVRLPGGILEEQLMKVIR